MSFPLSAGTGPAAAILVGGFLAFTGNLIGWIVMVGGFALSALWTLRFS